MIKIICVVGTRPEAIKMAPIILALQKESWAQVIVLATAQHRHMLTQVLDLFHIKPDIDLDVMRPNQSLTMLTSRLLSTIDDVLLAEKPDVVLVQGDTTTVMTVALACFYHGILIGHVEAGLRTGNIHNPFPEEANRVIVSHFAYWHFAPTESARVNLLKAGITDQQIVVTGNTVIDALLMMSSKNVALNQALNPTKRLILLTIHRRENFGEPLRHICRALKILAERNPSVQFLYPVHPNPNVHDVVYAMLSDCPSIHLCDPLDYEQFVAAMKRAYLIISDSGGVQEEAPALGKPVLVLREETERPEAVEHGVVKLIGSNCDHIVSETQRLLDDELAYRDMARGISPYGDGHSAMRTVQVLRDFFVKGRNSIVKLTKSKRDHADLV
ncbi:MAG: UDP-N-acetylglucosamine 2-epimerase (non-hydrolyzing) [Legionellaceae bacterium]|nr:UDP-N-acetylglucosamine 2-epimerase (non-hydrolyzing) [Legionellaceae bacterium]